MEWFVGLRGVFHVGNGSEMMRKSSIAWKGMMFTELLDAVDVLEERQWGA